MNPDMGRFEFTRGLFKKKKNTFFPFEILNWNGQVAPILLQYFSEISIERSKYPFYFFCFFCFSIDHAHYNSFQTCRIIPRADFLHWCVMYSRDDSNETLYTHAHHQLCRARAPKFEKHVRL
jgi:hypothetical protein